MNRRYIYIFILSTVTILLGTFGYMIVEHLSFFDSLWLTVVSVLTVGYGDIIPLSDEGKVFTLILIPIAIGIVTYSLGVVAASIIEGSISEEAQKKKMMKRINKMNNHFIISGFGRVGEKVFEQLQNDKQQVVVIDEREEVFEQLRHKAYVIQGDATDDSILIQAGVERAKGLVTTLPDDANNVFVTLTVKGMNPNAQVVARAEKDGSEEKLKRAGADRVISPSHIGGIRMAMSILKPVSTDYVDTIFSSNNENYNVEEIQVSGHSSWHNCTIKQLDVRANYGVTIVGVKRGTQFIRNPAAEEVIQREDVLIVLGEQAQLERFEQLV
ncbi:potassium channel family protein [Pontibacillus litoralis]|uniref:Potassium channel protein n=1 Tax=Pontibacillus litoralis JSM 072002 TaxID=1385512 RepID=A0A0A5G3A5_9BACI|nr:potassium channel protein [Pontibacillus litoralis]KGX86499.1 potassium channel protein [Pontibacillus litoralis JSM 072002]